MNLSNKEKEILLVSIIEEKRRQFQQGENVKWLEPDEDPIKAFKNERTFRADIWIPKKDLLEYFDYQELGIMLDNLKADGIISILPQVNNDFYIISIVPHKFDTFLSYEEEQQIEKIKEKIKFKNIESIEIKRYDFNDLYNVLIYQGKTYTFNTNQALMMKELYENYVDGKPVNKEYLLEKAESQSKSLRDAFNKNHQAWKDKLIKHVERGFYTLQ